MAVPLLSSVSHTTSTLFCHRSVVHTRRPLSSLFFQLPHNINPVCSILTHSSITYSSNLSPLAAIPFDLSPPPIDHDLYVVDLSHYGRIRVSGEDRIKFLHNQSTANFEALSEGGGCDTVFVTPTARTIDIAQAWIMKTAVTLVVSPATSKSISEMLNKYIFFGDNVEIQDISDKTCLFALAGPKSYQVDGNPVTVAVGSVISEEGFSLLMSPSAAGLIWKTILSHGATPMGSNALEIYRIRQGRPAPGSELTDEFNVLEAGLWNSISLNKGCYKGQETVARLITYDGIKQKLWGIELSSPVEPGSPITVEGKKVGKLTSYTAGKEGNEHFGLGYIKKKAASKGDTVIVGDNVSGIVVDVPYLADSSPPRFRVQNHSFFHQ